MNGWIIYSSPMRFFSFYQNVKSFYMVVITSPRKLLSVSEMDYEIEIILWNHGEYFEGMLCLFNYLRRMLLYWTALVIEKFSKSQLRVIFVRRLQKLNIKTKHKKTVFCWLNEAEGSSELFWSKFVLSAWRHILSPLHRFSPATICADTCMRHI